MLGGSQKENMDLSTPAELSGGDVNLKKYDKAILALMAIALLAAVGGIGWGIFILLPVLLTMAENGVILLVMLVVAVFLGLSLINIAMNFQNILLKMKMGAQSIRRRIISSDPIAAIDVSIANLQQQYDNACKLAAEADGATKQLSKQIRADDRKSGAMDKADNEDRLAKAAIAQGRGQDEINEHLVRSERSHRTADMLQPLLERQQERQRRIEEARKLSKAKIGDLNDQKENLTIMLDAYRADAKQSRALSAFFGQRSKEMATIEIAVDEIVRQGALAEAQIEQMLNDAEPQVQAEQLQRDADALAARARLSGALGNTKQLNAPSSTITSTSLNVKDAEVISIDRKR
jgi:hypothetical protein